MCNGAYLIGILLTLGLVLMDQGTRITRTDLLRATNRRRLMVAFITKINKKFFTRIKKCQSQRKKGINPDLIILRLHLAAAPEDLLSGRRRTGAVMSEFLQLHFRGATKTFN